MLTHWFCVADPSFPMSPQMVHTIVQGTVQRLAAGALGSPLGSRRTHESAEPRRGFLAGSFVWFSTQNQTFEGLACYISSLLREMRRFVILKIKSQHFLSTTGWPAKIQAIKLDVRCFVLVLVTLPAWQAKLLCFVNLLVAAIWHDTLAYDVGVPFGGIPFLTFLFFPTCNPEIGLPVHNESVTIFPLGISLGWLVLCSALAGGLGVL